MPENISRYSQASAAVRSLHLIRYIFRQLVCIACVLALFLREADAQFVDDGSESAIGKADTKTILALIARNVKDSTDAKVTSMRRSKGVVVCGSVNVKNKEGLYLGERGFVVDLATSSFGRVPEGPELMDPRTADFAEKERIRAFYFETCLD